MGFAESIYTTVAISFDGYSTDLLKKANAPHVTRNAHVPAHLQVHTRAHLCVLVERLSARA